MDFPITELMDEGACYAKLLGWLHPGGLACPRCGARDGLTVHRGHRAPVLDYRCGACRRVFNAFTDTLLHGTRRRPSELVLIARGIAQGAPTARLARELARDRSGLLRLRHKLQHAAWAFRDQARLPDRVAEADEMYQNAGEKRRPAHRPGRPAAAPRQPPPGPRQLGQRPAAGLRGRGAGQRPGPPGGDPDVGVEGAEPGGPRRGDGAGAGQHRRLAGVRPAGGGRV